ncbi:MAG: DUF5683 domain-containing protein [Ignavibacteria bacterium]
MKKSAAIKCSALLFFTILIFPGTEFCRADEPVILKQSELLTNSRLKLSDSTAKKKPKEFKMKKDPWKAVLFSALLPGAGQYYNESYWKIPVVLGLGGYFGYVIINNNNKYTDYKDRYEQSQTINNPDGDPQLKTFRDFYKDQRDDFAVYALILYVVNLIDAYVDAQLFDFDVSDSKSFPNSRMTLKINF